MKHTNFLKPSMPVITAMFLIVLLSLTTFGRAGEDALAAGKEPHSLVTDDANRLADEQSDLFMADSSSIPPRVRRIIKYIDLKCYRIEAPGSLNLRLQLDHLNPVLTALREPTERVLLQQPQQLCVPVIKNGRTPPPDVLDIVKHIDLKTYRFTDPPVDPLLQFKHLNPVLREMRPPREIIAFDRAEQLRVPVTKNNRVPPDNVRRIVENIDLKCYRIIQGQPLNVQLRLDHLNPLFQEMGLPPESVFVREPQQLCVPVIKNGRMPPQDVLDIVKFVDQVCYRIDGPPLNLPLRLDHLNPVFRDMGLPAENVMVREPQQLCVPIEKAYGPRELGCSAGHTAAVTFVALEPADGMFLATGSDDRTVAIWEPETGALVRRLTYNAPVRTGAWAPEGWILATGSQDGTVTITAARSGKAIMSLQGPAGGVESVAWSPDSWLAAGGRDPIVRIWDGRTGEVIAELPEHTDGVKSVAFSPDGSRLAVSSLNPQDGAIKIWDVSSSTLIAELRGHARRVESMAWSPDGTRLVSGSQDRRVIIWDVDAGVPARTLEPDREDPRDRDREVFSVAWSPDGSKIAIGSQGMARIWRLGDGLVRRLHIRKEGQPLSWATSVSWSPDGSSMAIGSSDTLVRMADHIRF